MTTREATGGTSELDRGIEAAHGAVLERLAPGTRSRRLSWSQGETRVLELGDGPPLVLVHGGFDNAALWAPVLAALATRHRVLAVDLPGHGLADPFDYEAADLAAVSTAFVRDVLDGLELERVDLAGCSVGGFVTTVFALDEPRRVRRLVLVGAPLGVTRDVPTPLRVLGLVAKLPLAGRALGRLALSRPSREKTRKLMGQIAVAHPEALDDEMLDADVLCQLRNRDTYLGLLRSLGTFRGLRLRPELCLGERWQELRVPTVFLRGERDAFVSAAVEEAWAAIVERNPRIRIVPVADAGHLTWLDAPGAVVRGIEAALVEDATLVKA
jgi:2-hydroxy-6-oxonona-2,4-dienedioate hydrolase